MVAGSGTRELLMGMVVVLGLLFHMATRRVSFNLVQLRFSIEIGGWLILVMRVVMLGLLLHMATRRVSLNLVQLRFSVEIDG